MFNELRSREPLVGFFRRAAPLTSYISRRKPLMCAATTEESTLPFRVTSVSGPRDPEVVENHGAGSICFGLPGTAFDFEKDCTERNC